MPMRSISLWLALMMSALVQPAPMLRAQSAPAPGAAALRMKTLVEKRDAKLVSVLPQGQLYHRSDHLVVHGARELTPEAAAAAGYSRCTECQPPETSQELVEETRKGRTISRYYDTYLKDRVAAVSSEVPPRSR
jgi:hypothetical protein